MKLSVILIAYDMQREIPRTLQSLSRNYQKKAVDLDYEVIVIDNGSPNPLDDAVLDAFNAPAQLLRIPRDEAHPSPASALNRGAELARGEVLCLMVDGAHLLTPGIFELTFAAMAAFENPVVATRYFYLGPDEQNISITQGYDKAVEDRLLADIDWPGEGYRLFEIGSPMWGGADTITWWNRMFESNCLFMKKSLYQSIGGADEQFDAPAGGFLNLDLYKRAADAPGVTPVQLVGEGSFHQLHGGTTTNVPMPDRKAQTARYREQYRDIRGHDQVVTGKDVHYLGHLPTRASKIHLLNPRKGHGEPLQ